MRIRTIIFCGALALPVLGVTVESESEPIGIRGSGAIEGEAIEVKGVESGADGSEAVEVVAVGAAGQDPSEQVRKNNGKFSGLIFGDFYSIPQHHDPAVKGSEGIWVRRLNLTFDNKWSDRISSRLRFEAKDNGNFSGGHDMVPFVKDAWLRYNAGGHMIMFGVIPTPTFAPVEDTFGYRPIEKSPLDLYRMGSSRDKGISIAGPLGSDGKADYTLMLGDGSGTKSMTGGTHTIYARIGYELTPELSVDLYGDWWKRLGGVDWTTVKGELFYVHDDLKAGFSYAHQLRQRPGVADVNLDVISFYGEYAATDTLSPFLRVDIVDDLLPDAQKIEYYRMSPDGKPTLVAIGLRIKVTDDFEITPSWTGVSYRGVGGAPSPGSDSIFRLTFSAKF